MDLATNASKSDIYTTPNAAGERCIMLVRTCLGEPQYTKEKMPDARKPAEHRDGRGAYNSVVAKTQTQGGCVEHPEFVVFDKAQVLPKYAIWYRHNRQAQWIAGVCYSGYPQCWCTHCVQLPIPVKLVCGDQHKQVEVKGTMTAGDIKTFASKQFNIPIENMGTVDNVSEGGTKFPFKSDNSTCADRVVYEGKTIEIILK